MAQAVSVRLDDLALRALSQLQATGLTSRLADKRALAAEVAALENDEADRAEMAMVADLMESLRAPR
jgi:hypothetical protein